MEATEASAAAAESPESRPPERTDAQLLELEPKWLREIFKRPKHVTAENRDLERSGLDF